MDNKKIGKLIADLRKKNGLTQQELGDKVGVGFRAVSKWERGLSLPDISIINEISKILGISSDELLAGKVTSEVKLKKKKIPLKFKISLSIVISLIVILVLGFIYNNNRVYTYELSSADDDSYVSGQVTIRNDDIHIIINKLNFRDKEFLKTKIRNYEYHMMTDNRLIIGYGITELNMQLDGINSIKDFSDNFRVDYSCGTEINGNDLIKNGLKINIKFENEDKQFIYKVIEIKLSMFESKTM